MSASLAVAEPSSKLAVIVSESGLEPGKAAIICEQFADYYALAAEWAEKAKALTVTSEGQKTEMKMAREGRLFLRAKRLAVESTRKDLKEQSLKEGRAIDAISAELKALIEPTEAYLQEQENFAARAAAARREKLKAERHEALLPYAADPSVYALADLSEEAFTELLNGLLAAKEAKAEAARKVEAERVATEKARVKRETEETAERERVRAENERLRAEAAARERAMAAERAEAERQRKEAEVQAVKEREAAEQLRLKAEWEAAEQRRELQAKADAEQAAAAELLRQERAAAEALRREAAAKLEAETRAQEARAVELATAERKRLAAEKKAKAAPDRDKLLALAATLVAVPLPELATAEAQQIIASVRSLIGKVNAYIEQKAAEL